MFSSKIYPTPENFIRPLVAMVVTFCMSGRKTHYLELILLSYFVRGTLAKYIMVQLTVQCPCFRVRVASFNNSLKANS